MLVLQRKLVEAETEGWGHGKEMVEDVGLDGFVFGPDLIAEEEVNFDGHSELSGFALGNDQVQVLRDYRVLSKVPLNVYSIELTVGRH